MVEANLNGGLQRLCGSFWPGKKQGWKTGLTWITWANGLTNLSLQYFFLVKYVFATLKEKKTKVPHQVCILVIPRIYRFVTFCCMWLPFGSFLWPKVVFFIASVPPFIIWFFILLRKSTNYPQILQSTFKLHPKRKTVPLLQESMHLSDQHRYP